jgi:preprotein translocase subunit YajC
MGLILLPVLLLLFWVLLIAPQRRRMREQQALQTALAVGDDVMTTAGLFGRITAMEGEEVRLEVAPGVELRFARAAIARRMDDTDVPSSPAAGTSAADADDGAGDGTPLNSDGPTTAPLVQPRRGLQRRRPADPSSPDPDADTAN